MALSVYLKINMSDGRLVLISTNMFKPASEEGGRPFMLSAAPLTASSISKEGEKTRSRWSPSL